MLFSIFVAGKSKVLRIANQGQKGAHQAAR